MTPAADALPINLFPTPDNFADCSVYELLQAASHGRIGIDKRLIHSILDRDDKDAVIADLVRFAEEAGGKPLDLRVDLTEIFRRLKTPLAIPLYLEILREFGDDYPEEIIQAVVEQREAIVEPLLSLHAELGEEKGAPVAFLLAGLGILDERILAVLVEEFEYDTWEGAFHLGMYGDPAAVSLLQARLAEPGLDDEMQRHLRQAIEEIGDGDARRAFVTEPDDLYQLFDDVAGPDFDALPDDDVISLMRSGSAEYRAAALDALSSDEVDDPAVGELLRGIAKSDSDPNVRGRAWEALASLLEGDAALLKDMKSVLNDAARPASERCGVLIALATATEGSDELKTHLKQMYEVESERVHVLKAMWRTMDQAYASYMRFNLDSEDPNVREQAVFGVGHLGITAELGRLEKLFEDDFLRTPALYSYARIVPGPKERFGVKSILKKIEKVAKGLDSEETDVVKTALDQRLTLRGMKPVFHEEVESGEDDE